MKSTITALPLAILTATSQVALSMQRGQEQPQDTTGLRHLKGKADKEKCLKAKMSTSNDYDGNVKGTVKVCFTDALGENTGSFKLKADGLPELIAGGVHIHEGMACTDSALQGGHYWNSALLNGEGPKGDGDAWFNIASSLAPTGTGYSTDEDGKTTAYFHFNNGYGYEDNKGHAVVIHGEVGTQVDVVLGDGTYPRVACGVLQ